MTWDGKASDAIFVFCPGWKATLGTVLEVAGQVIDYLAHDTAKPVTQIRMDEVQELKTRDADGHRYRVDPVEFTQDLLPQSAQQLATLLNSLAVMLVSICPSQTFIAPSNPFGDYVLALDAEKPDTSTLRSEHNGALIDKTNPLRWFPTVFSHRLSRVLMKSSPCGWRKPVLLRLRLKRYAQATSLTM